MHSDQYCGETIGTILKGDNALLWEYLPQRAIQLFQQALTAEVGSEPPEEPIPADRIWAKLEDEIICHSCFKDYIAVVAAYPPNRGCSPKEIGPESRVPENRPSPSPLQNSQKCQGRRPDNSHIFVVAAMQSTQLWGSPLALAMRFVLIAIGISF
jgi:hypothetical protein